MAITRTNMIDDDGTGTTGTIINAAWKTELYNQIDGIGTWVDIPFFAGNFATPTPGASWVVTAATYYYMVIGKSVHFVLHQSNTGTTTGAPGRLYIAVPGGLTSNRPAAIAFTYWVAGVSGTGVAILAPGSPQFDCLRDVTGTPYGAGTTSIYIQGVYSIA